MLQKLSRIEHYLNKAVKAGLESALSASYGIPNTGLRNAIERPVASINSLHRLVSDRRESRIYLASGSAAGSGQPLRVAFVGLWEIGQTNILPFYQHMLFEDGASELEDLGPCEGVEPHRQAEQLAGQADLVAVLAHRQRIWQPVSGDWVQYPSVIRMAFHFRPGEDWQAIERRMKSQRRNLSLIRRENYTCQITESDDDFHHFYERLYLPMVQNRYKDYGAIISEAGLYPLFKKKGVLMVVKDASGEIVSAGLNYARHKVLYALVNGVRDGDTSLVRRGALAAVHYYVIQHAYEMGMRRFDVGVGVPFQNDGVYQHKCLWGYEADWNRWEADTVLLWAPNAAPAAVDWLRANPVVPRFARWGGSKMEELYAGTSV